MHGAAPRAANGEQQRGAGPSSLPLDVTNVVAALIERRGRILICRRREDQDHAGRWEFPGGKVEQGETPRQALSRELREELGIHVEPGREIKRYRYQYPGRKEIELRFFHIEEVGADIDGGQFAEIRWEPVERLSSFDFLAGDVDFVKALARGDLEL